ncbi:MAG: CsgG/HfaB family protein [Elusimicrobiales bacterium]|nr:CsgG/HfaB family protein [Elusimicrobiales bacterium]
MKRLLLTVLAAAALAACGAKVRTAVRGDFDPAGRVAVMPFSGRDEETGLSLAEAFTTYLMDAGFEVMERAQLEKVLGEQKAALSGAMAPEELAQVGKLAGVRAVVTGSYRVRRENVRTVTPAVKAPPMPARPGRRPQPGVKQVPGQVRVETNTIFSGLTVKFVDVTTGRILLSSSVEKDYDADSVNKALAAMAESIKETLQKGKGEK